MKNISLGIICALILLPQVSFGAISPIVSPQQAACNQKLDAQAVAFFQKQGQERSAFIQANKSIIAAQDLLGKWKMNGSVGIAPPSLTAAQVSTLSAFTAQEQSEKMAFFKQQATDMQTCMGTTTGI